MRIREVTGKERCPEKRGDRIREVSGFERWSEKTDVRIRGVRKREVTG